MNDSISSNLLLAELPALTAISSPPLNRASNPFYNPNFFDLNFDPAIPDAVELTPRLLTGFLGGLRALAGNDVVKGSADSELINGNAGADSIFGGGGNDILLGGRDMDILFGGAGNDTLNGNKDNDYVYGEQGNDFVRGGQGNDNLVGGAGNDTVIGDFGIDKLWGSEGADLFVFRRETAAPAQEIGSAQPPSGNIFDKVVDEIPADFILDYNAAEGDVIALTGGLTVNDIILTERFLTIGDARDYDSSGPFLPWMIRTLEFRIENITATIISEASTGNILGLVKEVSPENLQFITVAASALA